jgi:hypothetical protein
VHFQRKGAVWRKKLGRNWERKACLFVENEIKIMGPQAKL